MTHLRSSNRFTSRFTFGEAIEYVISLSLSAVLLGVNGNGEDDSGGGGGIDSVGLSSVGHSKSRSQ